MWGLYSVSWDYKHIVSTLWKSHILMLNNTEIMINSKLATIMLVERTNGQ